jgi:hypothetical protein
MKQMGVFLAVSLTAVVISACTRDNFMEMTGANNVVRVMKTVETAKKVGEAVDTYDKVHDTLKHVDVEQTTTENPPTATTSDVE